MPTTENEVGFTPAQYPGIDDVATYDEQLEIGYRWYDAHGVTPAFPFGHGLTYSVFAFADARVVEWAADNRGGDRGGGGDDGVHRGIAVSFTMTNVGTVTAAEVAQVYVSYPADAGEPPRQLRGFSKSAPLAPGASTDVTIDIPGRYLSVWSDELAGWVTPRGEFVFFIGRSSRDVPLRASFHVD